MEQDIQFHTRRARDELHVGLTAPTIEAARAHLALATMHLERVRTLSSEKCEPLLRM